jgi:hypothetical protein
MGFILRTTNSLIVTQYNSIALLQFFFPTRKTPSSIPHPAATVQVQDWPRGGTYGDGQRVGLALACSLVWAGVRGLAGLAALDPWERAWMGPGGDGGGDSHAIPSHAMLSHAMPWGLRGCVLDGDGWVSRKRVCRGGEREKGGESPGERQRDCLRAGCGLVAPGPPGWLSDRLHSTIMS